MCKVCTNTFYSLWQWFRKLAGNSNNVSWCKHVRLPLPLLSTSKQEVSTPFFFTVYLCVCMVAEAASPWLLVKKGKAKNESLIGACRNWVSAWLTSWYYTLSDMMIQCFMSFTRDWLTDQQRVCVFWQKNQSSHHCCCHISFSAAAIKKFLYPQPQLSSFDREA